MQLAGENEVPPGRCDSVIQSVADHIFHVHMPQSDLPSMMSDERFADQDHKQNPHN